MASSSSANKRLGLAACTALVVGNMIGSGVFLLPASLAAYGPMALLGWIVTAIGAMALAIVFGRLARLVPRTGGPYAYTRAGFGEFAGFLIAWGYWIALWAGNAGVAVAFTGYLGHFVPAAAHGATGLAVALAALWTLTLVNIRGVGTAGIVQVATTVLKLLPLLALVLVGLAAVVPSRFTPLNPSGMDPLAAIAACSALTLWAFLGLESATVPAGEVDNPGRTIPLATMLGTSLAAALYILVTIVAFGAVPLSELGGSTAPLALVAERLWGAVGGFVIAAGAIVSTFGTLNGFTLLAGQVPFGAARDGTFPAFLGESSPSGSPVNALIVSSLLSSALIAMSLSRDLVDQFTFIILLATLTSLVPYIFCALAELVLYATDPTRYRPPDRIGGLIVLATIAFLFSLGAIYGAGAEVVFWGFLLLVSGLPVFVWIKRHTLAPRRAEQLGPAGAAGPTFEETH
ncbi:amino acid permease [Inquilinus limosus]|uniref:amino acid permease n=1 Tax=Inquilinus limosus TaxID=171674 RepID=UPI0004175549|nr:amino acid permease [Inquilinus limosus]